MSDTNTENTPQEQQFFYSVPYVTIDPETGEQQSKDVQIISILPPEDFQKLVEDFLAEKKGTPEESSITNFIEFSKGACQAVEVTFEYYIPLLGPDGEKIEVKLFSSLPHEKFGEVLNEFFQSQADGSRGINDLVEYSKGAITIPEETIKMLDDIHITNSVAQNIAKTEAEVLTVENAEVPKKKEEYFSNFFGGFDAKQLDGQIKKKDH